MPQLQMPPIIPAGEATERGIAGLQNAMVTRSRLKSAGIEQAEQQRAIAKRNELEQLLMRTPEPDRSRAAIEWSKVNDENLYGKLSVLEINKLQQGLEVNPEQAAQMFERNTGEKLTFDPMRGVHMIDMKGGSKLAIGRGGRMEQFNPPDAAKPFVVQGAGSAAFMPGEREPFYTVPTTEKLNTAATGRTTQVGNKIMQYNPETGRYDIEVGPAPPRSSLSMGMGMPQFVGIQDGQAAVYQPRRGSAGSMATIPLPGQGPLQPRTEPADVRGKRMGFATVQPSLDAIAELSQRINVNQGIVAKAIGGVERAKAQANLNDDVAEYESVVSGFTPLVARAVGHVGVLTEQDVQSVRKLFPSPGDSKSLRDRKIARLKSIIAGTQEAIGAVGGGGTATPKADPLGLYK